MKYVWIIVLFGILGTGGILAYNQGQSKTETTAQATLDGEQVAEKDISQLTGMAKFMAKLKNAFSGSDSSKKEEVAQTASRDLGRLGGHFRSAPPKAEN